MAPTSGSALDATVRQTGNPLIRGLPQNQYNTGPHSGVSVIVWSLRNFLHVSREQEFRPSCIHLENNTERSPVMVFLFPQTSSIV